MEVAYGYMMAIVPAGTCRLSALQGRRTVYFQLRNIGYLACF